MKLFWVTFIDIWRFLSGHTDSDDLNQLMFIAEKWPAEVVNEVTKRHKQA